MANVILQDEAVIRLAAKIGAAGDSPEYLVAEYPSLADDIREAARLAWEEGVEPDEVAALIAGKKQ